MMFEKKKIVKLVNLGELVVQFSLLEASASEGLDVVIHVVKIVVYLLHLLHCQPPEPEVKARAPVCVEHKLVSFVHVFHILVISLVETLPLLGDSISETVAVIPNLQSAARHHQKRLDIVFQTGPFATGKWIQT